MNKIKYATTFEGDEIVSQDIEKIKEAVEGKDFQSLVLYGSYGRGEGCTIEGEPQNDYDLLLIGGNKDVENEIENVDTACINEVMHIKEGSEPECTQKWFGIRYGSQLLAGEPLDLPDWPPYAIPFSDAVNSLGNRAVSLVLGKYEMMKDEPDWRKVIEQVAKGIIAVGDAVLIRRGEFHPSYAMRSHLLLSDEIGNLYRLACSIKMFNYPELNPDEIWNLWRQARGAMRQFAVDNGIEDQRLEILFSVNESHDLETLKELLRKLEVEERWL